VQVEAKDQLGVAPLLERAPAIASPEWTFAGVDRLALTVGAEIVIANAVDAAEKSPDVSATFRVNPDNEQAAVGVPDMVAVEVEKARPEQEAASVDEISDPLLL